MNLEVLISTMNCKPLEILNQMNIDSNAIIINQCKEYKYEEIFHKGKKIRVYSFDEIGVGLSRNNALMRSNGDICLIADDDVSYIDGYTDIIINAFKDNPKADIMLFNVPSLNINRPTYIIPRNSRVKWHNCLRYGAVKLAIRRESILKYNVYFSLLFGGGARYSAGEDSLFIAECIKKGMIVYANKRIIGYVKQEDSSWFNGYTDKYFIDKGIFFRNLNKKLCYLLCIQFALRRYSVFKHDKTLLKSIQLMFSGIKNN